MWESATEAIEVMPRGTQRGIGMQTHNEQLVNVHELLNIKYCKLVLRSGIYSFRPVKTGLN